MKHSEEEILAAFDAAIPGNVSIPPIVRSGLLRNLRGERPVLFTKERLLAETVTRTDQFLVHGIFGVLGTAAANEEALYDQAAVVGYTNTLSTLIGRAKAKEAYEVGATYRDADNRLYRYTAGGFLQYVLTGESLGSNSPKRPLQRI